MERLMAFPSGFEPLARYGRCNENFVLVIQIPAAAITSGDIKGPQAPRLV
jgi:hypothetical protein